METRLARFLSDLLSEPRRLWSAKSISDFARIEVPDEVFAGRRELLKCDVNALWASWYLEGICDPFLALNESHVEYAVVYKLVLSHVDNVMRGTPRDERINAARTLAKLIQSYVAGRSRGSRKKIEREAKLRLLDASSPSVRCWVCGFRFDDGAIRRFENGKSGIAQLPEFIDVFKPSGLQRRDYEIEVDHIVPFSAGGRELENLALTCGWCNRHKGAFATVYDQPLGTLLFGHPTQGIVSRPRPFWVIRLLATRRRCEFEGGCACTSDNSSLTVALRSQSGAANPTNLIVVCDQHDEMKEWRFVSRQYFKTKREGK